MNKTNKGLVEYAKAQVGKPYWFGTFGQTATELLYATKKRQDPKYYTANDYSSQYGQRVHDCVGLIKGYLWSDTPESSPKYRASQDASADGVLALCWEAGEISTMPEIPGILVFSPQHVGVYIGNGEVIEARGHAYGVVKTKLSSRGWKNWGKCPWIEYEEVKKEENLILAFQQAATADGFVFERYGCDGKYGNETYAIMKKCVVKKRLIYKYKNATKLVQRLLGVEQDGLCGNITTNAIKNFQKQHRLVVDGSCGPATWLKLLKLN